MNGDGRIILTSDGLKRIQGELEHLVTVHRREVAERIRDSKEFGELSENSEYEDAKTEQAFIEGKILELKRILQIAYVIQASDIPSDRVGIGTNVTVLDMKTNDEWHFSIVGSVEADPAENRISNESPVGEALMDKKVGAVVQVKVPDGKVKYKVISIGK